MNIKSLVVNGSGACIVHRMLSEGLNGYELSEVSPKSSLLPQVQVKIKSGDVVHALPDLGVGYFKKDTPCVMTFHGFSLDLLDHKHSSLFQRAYYRSLLRYRSSQALDRADIVTAVSGYTAQLVKKFYSTRKLSLEVIPNGVDIDEFYYVNTREAKRKPRILFSGNPLPRKGLDAIVYVVSALRQQADFFITGGLRGISNLSNLDSVQALGGVDHKLMPKVYADSDIFFFPSLREGMSLSLLEAMASGLPVVTTNVSSMPELIDEGRGGFLLNPFDYEGMKKCLGRLISEPSLRQEMGDYNREKVVSNYSKAKMLSHYDEVFSHTASKG